MWWYVALPWTWFRDQFAAINIKLDSIIVILSDDAALAKAAAELNVSTERLRAALLAQLREK